jgi:acetyltransferase-like isoleucine patch superfamily enzyme
MINDSRLIWGLRHIIYKVIHRNLEGFGYIGKPCFTKNLKRLYAKKGLGIFPGARIEILDGKIEIGENVRIGQNLTLNCGSRIEIGSNTTISANVFIGTTKAIIKKGSSFREWQNIEIPIHIGENCFIGYGAILLPGTKLGNNCVVGANSVVKGTFPDDTIIGSERAKKIGKLDA